MPTRTCAVRRSHRSGSRLAGSSREPDFADLLPYYSAVSRRTLQYVEALMQMENAIPLRLELVGSPVRRIAFVHEGGVKTLNSVRFLQRALE